MVTRIYPKHMFDYDGVTLNIFHPNKGEGLPQHHHMFSHATVCHAGSIIIRKEGKELIMTKNTQPVNLVANEWHEVEALEDNTSFTNIFSSNKQA